MQRKLSVPDLAVFAVVMGGRRAAEGRRFKLGSFGVRWMSQLLAPASRGHPHQRLEGGGKSRFQPAGQRAAVAGEHAGADTGAVRQPGKSGDAVARREALFKELRIAAFGAVAEHINRSDSAIRTERGRLTKHRFARDRAAIVEQHTTGGVAYDDGVAAAIERPAEPFGVMMRQSVDQDRAAAWRPT